MPKPKKSTSSPLTKEHFDKAITSLATKEHLKAEGDSIRNKIAGLENIMNIKFDAIIELLDVRKEVEQLKLDVLELKKKQTVN